MNTREILCLARAKIASGFCQHVRGMDDSGGLYLWGYDPKATRWCALGAIDAALGQNCWGHAPHPAVTALAKALGKEPIEIAAFNNSHTQTEVVELFDRAIAMQTPRKTDSELVADLMRKITTERIPEDA